MSEYNHVHIIIGMRIWHGMDYRDNVFDDVADQVYNLADESGVEDGESSEEEDENIKEEESYKEGESIDKEVSDEEDE